MSNLANDATETANAKPVGHRRIGTVSPRITKRKQQLRGPADDAANAPAASAAFPQFSYRGGPIVRTPQVHAMFVGDWSSSADQGRATRLGQFVKDMLNSEYMNILSQYGCGISGTLASSVFVANGDTDLSNDDIHRLIQSAIDSGTVPDASPRQAYLVVLDDATGVNDSAAGAVMCEASSDTAFGFHDFFKTSSGRTCYFAVVPGLTDTCLRNTCPASTGGDGSCSLHLAQSQEARQTQVISHELSELFTDPEVGSNEGWSQPGRAHENGDICNGMAGTITVGRNNWNVQLMYSKTQDDASAGATTCVATAPLPLPSLLPLQAWQLAASDTRAYLGNVPRVVYRNTENHVHEIAIDPATGRWVFFDMSAATGAPPAVGVPMGYADTVPRVVYRSADGHIHEIAIDPQSGTWVHFDMTASTAAPLAAGDPMGYVGDVPRVVYRGVDNHVHEIAIHPETGTWGHFDLSAATGAPAAAGDPMGYMDTVPRVVYRGADNHVHEIAIYPENGQWGHFDMSAATGAPPTAGDPMGYRATVPRVIYRGVDNHVHEIAIYPENGNWGHFDMSAATGAPPAAGDPMGYLDTVPRVVYRGVDKHVHEIAIYPEAGNWGHFDMSAGTGAPAAAGDPMGYVGTVPRVIYRGADNHVHEIAIYPESGNWGHYDMSGVMPYSLAVGAIRLRAGNAAPPPPALDGEFIAIANDSAWPAQVQGWTLQDAAGHVFTLPSFVLESQAVVRVWTKAGSNDADNLFWGHHMALWNNSGDMALLRDDVGTEIDRITF